MMVHGHKPTSAKPKMVDGVTFRCYSTGIMQTRWFNEDGRLAVGAAYNLKTYWAAIDGKSIPTKFRKLETAMQAAVTASRNMSAPPTEGQS